MHYTNKVSRILNKSRICLIMLCLYAGGELYSQNLQEFDLNKFNYSICSKREKIHSGIIFERTRLTNSNKEIKGLAPSIDTIIFKFSISPDGQKTAWSKSKMIDRIQFKDNIYLINHFKKEVVIEDINKSEYCNELNNGISNDYIESIRCDDKVDFTVDSIGSFKNVIEIESSHNQFLKDGGVSGYNLKTKYVDSIMYSLHAKLSINEIVYSMQYDLLKYELNEKPDPNIMSEIENYLNGIMMSYNMVQSKSKTNSVKPVFDSSILKQPWQFYDLDSNLAAFENQKQVIIFTFIGCLGCEWLISDLSKYYDSANLTVKPVFVYVYDPIQRIKDRSYKYGDKFEFLVSEGKYVESSFQFAGYPTVIILDNNKNLIFKKSGYSKDLIPSIEKVMENLQ